MTKKVIKKDGTLEDFDAQKILSAVGKSSARVMVKFSKEQQNKLLAIVNEFVRSHEGNIPIADMHHIVETALDAVDNRVAKSYRDYRNYKQDFVRMLDEVYSKSQAIRYIGDRSNANTDSALVPTQRSLIYNELNSELYKKFFLNSAEREAMKDGYIYIHDRSARLDTHNCMLVDINAILDGGFEMGNVWYNEPKTLEVAFDVISDITMTMAACQYGGFTIPRVDTVLAPYAEKSYRKYFDEYVELTGEESGADEYAYRKVYRDMEQGFQSWEYRFNTVGSSRGDYPFIAVSFGIDQSRFGQMATEVCLKVRAGGQGKEGKKKPVLFPKLTFLYDENLHGKDKPLEYLFEYAIDCCSKAMYPDLLSLSGKGYIPSMYKKYGKVVSLMGCVEGNSKIIWEIDNQKFYGSFESMWNMLQDFYTPIPQPIHGCEYYDTSDGHLKIYDTTNGFVKVKKVIKNITYLWVDVTLGNGKSLRCTPDHPLPTVTRGRIYASQLALSDTLLTTIGSRHLTQDNTVSKEEIMVTPVTKISLTIVCDGQYSYDVETESDHFEVNGIDSHNCRASLSPWYKRGGMYPADEKDEPVFEGRCNLGAISLHLPMILAKSRQEGKDFYEVLDYYLEMIRNLHKRTFDFLGEKKASINPLAYCEGGMYGGHLNPDDKIRPILAPMTMSFGITALNELQVLYNGESIVEDGQFALEVMEYINKKVGEFKEADGILFAIYATPAESLAGLQVEQFRKKYGIIKGVSDRPYVTNSFHCGVWENITPIQKQDLESRFWDLFNGGKIQYCRYPVSYNREAIKTLVRRAMNMGFYEGINLSLAYCEDCGYEELDMDVCPKCGSENITKIDRMNGYLGYTRIHGKTRYNDAKNAEIKDRVSM